MTTYEQFIEKNMRDFYDVLPEHLQRIFAALSVDQLGYGGNQYITQLFECSPMTVLKGKQELDNEFLKKITSQGRQRKKGGGRKKKL